MGDSVAVIDPVNRHDRLRDSRRRETVGLAVGEGSVWSAIATTTRSADLPEIPVRSHTIGLSVAPTDVEVIAGSVCILSDLALLRVYPGINDVSTLSLSREPVSPLVLYGGLREDCLRLQLPGGPAERHPHLPCHHVRVIRTPSAVRNIAYGEGALWRSPASSTRSNRSTLKTNAAIATHSARTNRRDQWLALSHDSSGRCDLVLAPASLWKIYSTTKRFVGSVPLEHSEEGGNVLA